jgi:hypothetical protein
MKRVLSGAVAVVVLVGLGFIATTMLADTVGEGPGDGLAAATGDECCFTNPRYQGTCRVAPAEDESCGNILAYLNNPNSVGKSYCGNTRVRGGWQQVRCDENSLADSAE